ncbi:MAG: hypothetical protein KF777_15760 [Planctomycetaceae bacterium]|nr:hypothetical protein [Planctomycetaceae bacterium]
MTATNPRVLETSTTSGTGELTVNGAARTYQRLRSAGAQLVNYVIEHETANEFEEGLGTITQGANDTLSRIAVIRSSNANALVNFSAGLKKVFLSFGSVQCGGAVNLKRPAVAAATSNTAIATGLEAGDEIDGVTLATGNLVLLAAQAPAAQNGVYVVPESGAASRAPDLYTGDYAAGALVPVLGGNENGGKVWLCTSPRGDDVVGTNNLSWQAIGGTDGEEWVSGPESSTDRAVATWDGTDGDTLRDNPDWTISSAGKMAGTSAYSPIVDLVDAGTVNIDWNLGRWYRLTLGGNRTLTVTNVSVGQMIKLQLVQDGDGSRTVTWFDGITWPGGVVPTLTTTANRWDNFTLACYGVDGYGNPLFEGYVNGLNFGV